MVLQGFFIAHSSTDVLASTAGYHYPFSPQDPLGTSSSWELVCIHPKAGSLFFSNPKEASSPDGDASIFTVNKIALI